MNSWQWRLAGVDGLMLYFDGPVDAQRVAEVAQLSEMLRAELADCLIDLVPSGGSILLQYDYLQCSVLLLKERAERCLTRGARQATSLSTGKLHHLPVCYQGEDLFEAAQLLGLSVEALIALHSQPLYSVFSVGFTPGFAYLGELSEQLQLPRKSTPRTSVPAGSVAMAERRTAVYPQSTPGGWWLLGHCDQSMFNLNNNPPGLLQLGDQVQFYPVGLDGQPL